MSILKFKFINKFILYNINYLIYIPCLMHIKLLIYIKNFKILILYISETNFRIVHNIYQPSSKENFRVQEY